MDDTYRPVGAAANDPASRPVRVLGLAQDCAVSPPAQMTLLSVEEWTTFFVLRWFFATPEPSDEIDIRLQSLLRWTVSDDIGTEYAGGDYGGMVGNSAHWVATSWFAPPVSAAATVLRFRFNSPVDGSETDEEVRLRP